MAQVSYPGVYIEEFAPAPPIQPAGTSVAGFVGFAEKGPINEPTRITSFSQFQTVFGQSPVSGFYLWYAVRGFFENGGTDCFVVRASNGTLTEWSLTNKNQKEIFKAFTRKTGNEKKVTLELKALNRLDSDIRVFAKKFEILDPMTFDKINKVRELTVADGYLLRPGDRLKNGQDPATVIRVTPEIGGETKIVIDRALSDKSLEAAGKVSIELEPVGPNTRVLRIEHLGDVGIKSTLPDKSLVPGALIQLQDEVFQVDRVDLEFLNHPADEKKNKLTYRVTFRNPLGINLDRSGTPPIKLSLIERELVVKTKSGDERKYIISADASHPSFAPKVINDFDPLIRIDLTSSESTPSALVLAEPPGTIDNIEGNPEESTKFPSSDGIGLLSQALRKLTRIPDINLIAIPDACGLSNYQHSIAVSQDIVSHCEGMSDRFGILDAYAPKQSMFAPPDTLPGIPTIYDQVESVRSSRGYAALYYPWLKTKSADRGAMPFVPPSGHVCGLIARVDKGRGVHKAPANEILNDAITISRDMTDVEQGILNLQGINIIRTFSSGGRPTVFGARTTATDTNWQYVNVRRLFLFLEESISRSLRTSLFEPNNTELWGRLNRVITAFLTKQWQDGALFGRKAEEAFYVKIDEELNPFNEQALGKLNIEIGVRPTYPAEFIVVRIGIWDGGVTMSEA